VCNLTDLLTPGAVNKMADDKLSELASESLFEQAGTMERIEILEEGLDKCRRYRPREMTGPWMILTDVAVYPECRILTCGNQLLHQSQSQVFQFVLCQEGPSQVSLGYSTTLLTGGDMGTNGISARKCVALALIYAGRTTSRPGPRL
jgi:hypothetical protein